MTCSKKLESSLFGVLIIDKLDLGLTKSRDEIATSAYARWTSSTGRPFRRRAQEARIEIRTGSDVRSSVEMFFEVFENGRRGSAPKLTEQCRRARGP